MNVRQFERSRSRTDIYYEWLPKTPRLVVETAIEGGDVDNQVTFAIARCRRFQKYRSRAANAKIFQNRTPRIRKSGSRGSRFCIYARGECYLFFINSFTAASSC